MIMGNNKFTIKRCFRGTKIEVINIEFYLAGSK